MTFAASVASVLPLVIASAALADPVAIITTRDLTNTTLTGHLDAETQNGWFSANFFTISANAGDHITFSGARLTGALDPAIYVFEGDMTGFAFGPNGEIPNFDFITFGDDELSPNLPGPYGDPRGDFPVLHSGIFTLLIISNGSDASPSGYDYRITASGSTVVPTPAAAAALGLSAAASLRRRRR
ncbi:MAG: hypothetical protein QM783_17250 [Phycisphaerales bacterium]